MFPSRNPLSSPAFLIIFVFYYQVFSAVLNQDLSPLPAQRGDIPTRTREKRDTQASCDGLYGYPPPSACEAALAMLPTDAPNLFGILGPATTTFYSFEPRARNFFMLDEEGENGNTWAAGNCIIRLRLRPSLGVGAVHSEDSTWTKIRAKVQEILDRCVTTLPSTGGYGRVGNGQDWDEITDDIPGTGNLEIFVFAPWSRYDTGGALPQEQLQNCAEAQSEHASLPDYCTASLQSSEYCTGTVECHSGTSCQDSKIKQDVMGIMFGAVVRAEKVLLGTCIDSSLLS